MFVRTDTGAVRVRFSWLATIATAVALLLGLTAGPAAAQGYGDLTGETFLVGEGTADEEGRFRTLYTAPDEINEAFLVYVVGTDDEGEPFEWVVAQVTPAFAGLTWSLQGADMEPGSDYVLEARYLAGTEAADEEAEADGSDDAEEETEEAAAEEEADESDDAEEDEAETEDDAEEAAADVDGDSDGGGVGGPIAITLIAIALFAGLAYIFRQRSSRVS